MSGAFLRLDPAALAFARLLDGRRSVGEALNLFNAQRTADPLPAEVALALVEQLRRQGFLVGADGPKGAHTRPWLRASPLILKLSCGNPDRYFAALNLHVSWLAGRWTLLPVLAAIGFLCLGIVGEWDRFAAGTGALVSRDGLFWGIVAWVVTKMIHESAHGLVVKHYGGEVRDAGVLFVLFVPLGGYVDASSAWRFKTRAERLHVTLAGIGAELIVAAFALAVWQQSPAGEVHLFAQATVVLVVIGTLVFNANPLMRFDGYYALADLIDRPNLAGRGQAATVATVRYLLGVGPGTAEPLDIRVYGWLALFWRWLVVGSLIFLAGKILFGFGAALAAAATVTLVLVPLTRFASQTIEMAGPAKPRLVVRSGIALVLLAALAVVPVPVRPAAPGLVDIAEPDFFRTEIAARVAGVTVAAGESVEAGRALARLENADLDAEVLAVRARLDAALAREAMARRLGDLAEAFAAAEAAEVLARRAAELDDRAASLNLTARRPGTILSEAPEDLIGRWLPAGAVVVEVGDPSDLVVTALIDAADAADFRRAVGMTVRFVPDAPEHPVIYGVLRRVAPGTASSIPEALQATADGPIAMQDIAGTWRPVRPQVEAEIVLDETEGLRPGERGVVRLERHWQSLGELGIERLADAWQSYRQAEPGTL